QWLAGSLPREDRGRQRRAHHPEDIHAVSRDGGDDRLLAGFGIDADELQVIAALGIDAEEQALAVGSDLHGVDAYRVFRTAEATNEPAIAGGVVDRVVLPRAVV